MEKRDIKAGYHQPSPPPFPTFPSLLIHSFRKTRASIIKKFQTRASVIIKFHFDSGRGLVGR